MLNFLKVGTLVSVALYLCLALIPLVNTACTDEEGSMRALRSSGYTDIRLGGYDWMSCSKSDTFSTHFTAKNPQGMPVSGTVCCGWMKSCTVRF